MQGGPPTLLLVLKRVSQPGLEPGSLGRVRYATGMVFQRPKYSNYPGSSPGGDTIMAKLEWTPQYFTILFLLHYIVHDNEVEKPMKSKYHRLLQYLFETAFNLIPQKLCWKRRNLKSEERLCELCDTNSVEDEFHFLL